MDDQSNFQLIPTSRELSQTTLGSAYTLNSWSLHLFAVLKAHHGKGYGRALFNYAEAKVQNLTKRRIGRVDNRFSTGKSFAVVDGGEDYNRG